MEENTKDALVPVWVVGEISIEESKLNEKGAQEAAQDELDDSGFRVAFAEPV